MRIGYLCAGLLVASLLVGCVDDAPGVDPSNNELPDAGGTRDTGSDGGSATDAASMDVGSDAEVVNGLAYGEACALDGTANCAPDLTCLNLAGSALCTNECASNDDCPTGTCAGGTCWPTEENCGPGGTFQVNQCVYDGSCASIRKANQSAPTGHYVIEPGTRSVTVWCDMDLHEGAGFTILKRQHSGADTADAHVATCEDLGLQLIVPRSRAHMKAITDYVGSAPPIVNVLPQDGLEFLHYYSGTCGNTDCAFYLSDEPTGSCADSGLDPEGERSARLRYAPSNCPGGSWTNFGEVVDFGYTVCSSNDAAPPRRADCLSILNDDAVQNRSASGLDGVYQLSASGQSFDAYCDMTHAGGGWTLAARVDGAGQHNYQSSFWTDSANVNEGAPGISRDEHRNVAFRSSPFTQVRVSFESEFMSDLFVPERSVLLAHQATSLLDVFQSEDLIQTTTPRAAWITATGGEAIQPHCNQSGFNVATADMGPTNHSVRIGLRGNDEPNCDTPDSSIGVGIRGTNGNSADGVEAVVAGRAGLGTSLASLWAFIFVRNVPVEADCEQLREAVQGRDGTYPFPRDFGLDNQDCSF